MPKVFVAGSVNMDLVATASKLPRPGETIAGRSFRRGPGGKGANQALAAAKLGVPTSLVARVGSDAFGGELCAFLEERGLDTTRVRRVDAPTGVALIVVDGEGENSIVVVPGANDCLTPQDVDDLPLTRGDVALSQLEVPGQTIARFFELATARGALTVLNAAPARLECAALLSAADVLLLNEVEAATFGGGGSDPARALEAARRLRARASQTVIVSLGPRGVVAVGPEGELALAGHDVPVVDTTGAGDVLAGALAARLALGDPWTLALEAANAAAALSVGHPGAAESTPSASAVMELVARSRERS